MNNRGLEGLKRLRGIELSKDTGSHGKRPKEVPLVPQDDVSCLISRNPKQKGYKIALGEAKFKIGAGVYAR